MSPADTLVIPLAPVTKARARVGKGGRVYTPAATRNYEADVGLYARRFFAEPNQSDDLGVEVTFYLASRQRRDIDNLVKALFDGLNGVAWRDDAQVTDLRARLVRDGSDPRTELRIYVTENRSRKCERCRKALTLTQVNGRQRFCSKACYDTDQRQGVYRACSTCGGAVYRQNDKAGARRVYCSEECKAAPRGACRVCGTQLNAPPSAKRATCSPKCSDAYHRARESANPSALKGTCAECDAPCSRRAKRCRACFQASSRRAG